MEAGSDLGQCLTPSLIYAIRLDKRSLLEQLVSSPCCDVDELDHHSGLVALDIAAKKNRLWMVKRLLEAGADVKKAKHALWEAVGHSNCEMVLALTKAGADVDWHRYKKRTLTPLFRAVRMGSLEICRMLLEAGADPKAKTNRGFHVLSSPPFPENGFKELLKLLIDFGFDVNVTDWKGYSPMHVVIERFGRSDPDTCTQYVKILLDAGARCDDQAHSRETPLSLAIRGECCQCVEILLSAGCNVNTPLPEFGVNPMLVGVDSGNLDLVRTLVTAGADPNIPNGYNTTPLCLAVRNGFVDIVRYLVSLNVDLEVPSLERNLLRAPVSFEQSGTLSRLTPLFYAVVGYHWEIIEVLIEAGYDIWRERWLVTGTLTAENVYGDWEAIRKVADRLGDVCRNVPKLQHVCKMAIRKTYRTGLSERLRSLVLPRAIKKYLLLDGIENHKAQN